MQTNYTDQDTARVRQTEQSAIGTTTQRLSSGITAISQSGARNNTAALLLMGLGVFMLVGRMLINTDDMMAGMVLLTIASCLLFFAFWKRIYGLLIPGSILSGLSIGVPFADVTNGVSVLWGLALGFLAIFFLGKNLFKVQSSWPIFPAVPLFGVGIILAAESSFFLGMGLIWMPLLLIGAGLYLGWGRKGA